MRIHARSSGRPLPTRAFAQAAGNFRCISRTVTTAAGTEDFTPMAPVELGSTSSSAPRRAQARSCPPSNHPRTPPDVVASLSARQVVLLEDHHVDEQAWHEVVKEEPRVVDDAAASRYAMSLTFVVSAALIILALLIAYGASAASIGLHATSATTTAQ